MTCFRQRRSAERSGLPADFTERVYQPVDIATRGNPPRSAVGGDRGIPEWQGRAKRTEPDALVFSTHSGKPISPNNVSRHWIFPACARLGLPNATWLTFRRTYASWAHEKGVPGKVVAQLMGHAKADVTLNVYTQVLDGSLRSAVDCVGRELFTIVHSREGATELTR